MAEMETLVDAMQALIPANHHGQLCPCWRYRSKTKTQPSDCDCWQRPRCAGRADAALSWLASVLADDATVEVVARAIWAEDMKPATEDVFAEWNEWPGIAEESRASTRAGLAALSAHLAAPGPAGDTSGEVGR